MPLVTCYNPRIFPPHEVSTCHYGDVKYNSIKYIVNPTPERGLKVGSNGQQDTAWALPSDSAVLANAWPLRSGAGL
jgi:hypothetical protein